MQKTTQLYLAIFITLYGACEIVEAAKDPFKKTYRSQNISIPFTAGDIFGGGQAQATYRKRGKTATIVHNNTTYSFHKITEDQNPFLTENKKNLTYIGYFSNKVTRSEMPVITHIFGAPSNVPTQKAIQADILHSFDDEEEQSMQDSAGAQTSAPINHSVIFNPSEHYKGQGLVGNYDSAKALATINDPSQQNKQMYTFKNVQEKYQTAKKSARYGELVLIGSYKPLAQCSKGTPKICSDVVKTVNLYGKPTDNQ